MATNTERVPKQLKAAAGPEQWWKNKKTVGEKIGNAVLRNKADGVFKRVSGLFQARGTSSSQEDVQLKVTAESSAGAQFTLLPLAEALDEEKWEVLAHFCSGTFRLGDDRAVVKHTIAEGGTIKKVSAIMTMAGQPPMAEAEYDLEAFIGSWMEPEPETVDLLTYNGTGADTQEVGDPEDVTVEDPDVLVELDGWPTLLAHLRIMGKLGSDATDVTREGLVPWVAAALGMQWKGAGRAKLGDEELIRAMDKLDQRLKDKASPHAKRLKRFVAVGAMGNSPGEHGESLGRLYLDGAAETLREHGWRLRRRPKRQPRRNARRPERRRPRTRIL